MDTAAAVGAVTIKAGRWANAARKALEKQRQDAAAAGELLACLVDEQKTLAERHARLVSLCDVLEADKKRTTVAACADDPRCLEFLLQSLRGADDDQGLELRSEAARLARIIGKLDVHAGRQFRDQFVLNNGCELLVDVLRTAPAANGDANGDADGDAADAAAAAEGTELIRATARKWAAWAIANLCVNHRGLKDAVREAGGVQLLVHLVDEVA